MVRSKIFIADDHRLVIEALLKLLEPQFDVVGTATDRLSLLQAAPPLKPDVVVIDLIMPLLNGLEAGRQLKGMMPAVKLVFVTMNEDPEIAREAMREGASGYLLKSSVPEELFQAIRTTLKQGTPDGSILPLRLASGSRIKASSIPFAMRGVSDTAPRRRQIHEGGGRRP